MEIQDIKECYEKDVSVKYYLPKQIENNTHHKVQVCRKTFFSIFQVGERRVKEVCKRYFHTGSSPGDNRGGNMWSSEYADIK